MRVSSIHTGALGDVPKKLDLLICACGYETRATYVADQLVIEAEGRIALGFSAQQELQYAANRAWFIAAGFELLDVDENGFSLAVRDALRTIVSLDHPLHVAVDISCLNRSRLARLVTELAAVASTAMEVSFIYCIAKYSPPVSDMSATSVVEPVTAEFAGWTTYPDRPPAAVLGLGYEESRAIGIVDHLEITNATWAFVPVGPIAEYSESVDAANSSLYAMIGVQGRRIAYEVTDPASLFRELNSLIELLMTRYNPIIIPFGPKVFALVSMLVATLHEEVGVWRVSSGVRERPSDRLPSEHVTVLHVRFQPD